MTKARNSARGAGIKEGGRHLVTPGGLRGQDPGRLLERVEALAEQEDPFTPYPILYLVAKRR